MNRGPILKDRLAMYQRLREEARQAGTPLGHDAFHESYIRFVELVQQRKLGGIKIVRDEIGRKLLNVDVICCGAYVASWHLAEMSAIGGKADMRILHCKCLLLTQSGHQGATGLSPCATPEPALLIAEQASGHFRGLARRAGCELVVSIPS